MKDRRIFIELHTYDKDIGDEARVLLNIDEISGILEYSKIAHCKASIILNGSISIDIVEDYDFIIEKISQLKDLNS